MFRRIREMTVVCAVVLALPFASDAEELVREFKGTNSTITAEFEVTAPWILDWRVNSDYARFMAIDIVLLDGKTGFQVGRVKHKKEPDDGVRLFKTSGRYKVRVDSSHTRWQLKIIQLTEAEAELYTPK